MRRIESAEVAGSGDTDGGRDQLDRQAAVFIRADDGSRWVKLPFGHDLDPDQDAQTVRC